MKVTAITATGNRPEALALLDKYMQRQTRQDFRWVVLDDCDPVEYYPQRADKFIRPSWRWDGENTQCRSMLELLKEPGPVVICEDDDWVAPNWIENVCEWLEHDDLVGENYTHYYHVVKREWLRHSNRRYSSLCATACRDEAKEVLIRGCRKGVKFLDIYLWKRHSGTLYESDMVVGIKGMPGRAGIGMGHITKGTPDKDFSKLKELLGEDARIYMNYKGE